MKKTHKNQTKPAKKLKLFYQEKFIEAGCDEAGRGCLAGPVYAAAVIWPQGKTIPRINDSKTLNEKVRNELRIEIEANAIAHAVAWVDNREIDKINILNASFLAMHRALDKLKKVPELLIIDGNRFNTYKKIQHECIIGGDGKYASIAAASILAKTYRDEFMLKIHEEFGQYGWDHNKGYATRFHKQAISRFGLSMYHRRSFNCMAGQLKLDI